MPLLPHTRYHRRRVLSGDAPVDQSFMLQRVQPALSGLMDGSLSTLTPSSRWCSRRTSQSPRSSRARDRVGRRGQHGVLRRAVGHRRSDRKGGNPFVRRAITGGGTFLGGLPHPAVSDHHYQVAIAVAVAVVGVELVLLGWLRTVFFRTSFGSSFVSVTLGGAIIAAVSSALGVAGG
jgi:VIT1/CCC1 family predicted Fe2+/Mn2+ transporter